VLFRTSLFLSTVSPCYSGPTFALLVFFRIECGLSGACDGIAFKRGRGRFSRFCFRVVMYICIGWICCSTFSLLCFFAHPFFYVQFRRGVPPSVWPMGVKTKHRMSKPQFRPAVRGCVTRAIWMMLAWVFPTTSPCLREA